MMPAEHNYIYVKCTFCKDCSCVLFRCCTLPILTGVRRVAMAMAMARRSTTCDQRTGPDQSGADHAAVRPLPLATTSLSDTHVL